MDLAQDRCSRAAGVREAVDPACLLERGSDRPVHVAPLGLHVVPLWLPHDFVRRVGARVVEQVLVDAARQAEDVVREAVLGLPPGVCGSVGQGGRVGMKGGARLRGTANGGASADVGRVSAAAAAH